MRIVKQSLTGIQLEDDCQKTIVEALKAAERLEIDYLILFVQLARQMSKDSPINPVPALVNLLDLAFRRVLQYPDKLWQETAETLLVLGVQDTAVIESIIESMELPIINNPCPIINDYQRLSAELMHIININDAGTLKRFMASKSQHVRRFVLTKGCMNRESIWNDEESQKCLESVYSTDSNHTCAILAAFALARSGRKDLAPVLLEILEDSKFSEEFRDSDEVINPFGGGLEAKCINILCSFHESKALPIFIELIRKDHIHKNNLSESLLDNANYMHFQDSKMAELLCLLLEKADLNYTDRLSEALIKLGNPQVSDRLEKFYSSDERRLIAAFKALAGLNETERLINVILNSESKHVAAAGSVLSSITDKSLTEKIVSNYQPQLSWSRRKALIISLRSSKETLNKVLEIEKDYELKKLIEETMSS